MQVQGMLGWGMAACGHEHHSVRPFLAHPPHPGEAPRQHHPTPVNIWDRQVCAKLPGWAGQGWGGWHCLHPCCGEGETRLSTLALGLSQERLL